MKPSLQVSLVTAAALALLGGGYLAGMALHGDALAPWLGMAPTLGQDAQEGEEHDDHGHDDHLPLSEQAFKNLGLKLGAVGLSDYVRGIRIPAQVIEKPGHSDHAIASPVNGLVTRIYALPGQAVRPGDRLFDLQVVDEGLAAAQLALLEALTRIEVIDTELRRLEPLVESGTVSSRRRLDLEYERKQEQAKADMRRQELAMRGLGDEQIEAIASEKQLVRTVTVRLPDELGHEDESMRYTSHSQDAGHSHQEGADPWHFTIEELTAFHGKAVRQGENLCHLAYHTVLYLQGRAFESEMEHVQALSGKREPGVALTAEFGPAGQTVRRQGLAIQFIDNHVDPASQTFSFFVPLPNEIVDDHVGRDGRRYRSWRYKPGQRATLWLPVQRFERQIKLPREALTWEGPEAYVFRKVVEHDHAHHEHAEEPFIEFEPVPVHVLWQDEQWVVISPESGLRPGQVVALNGAYQLHLALKSQAGGGHDHGHDH